MLAREGLSKSEFGATIQSRFQRYCGVPTASGCIEWTGTKTKKGYGVLRLAGAGSRKTTAHRIAWALKHGDLAANVLVLHRCDNPSCVNPNHLFIGSAKQNTEDMVSKGRHSWRSGTPWQKLTVEAIARIRDLRANGLTQQRVADMFGISRSLISLIENGKIKHAASVIA